MSGELAEARLLARAAAGNGDAFEALTQPYRRELQLHCYRILGSIQDAEDLLQETLLAAWRGLAGFEARASLRSWLYRIATNRCLNALRKRPPRELTPQSWPDPQPPAPTRRGRLDLRHHRLLGPRRFRALRAPAESRRLISARGRVSTSMTDTEKTIHSNGAEICAQSFGRPGDPAVLLIMGQMASMLWWPAALCERLAGAGRFVIRYDNRDTGRSTSYEPGSPPYTLDDLSDDAVAVLDGYGIDRAHVAGMSMGGVIAQLVALRHPERVSGVTAISTTPVGEPADGLPGSDAAYREHAASFERLDWSDTEALAELLVRDARRLAGTRHPFDEAATRELVARDLQRTRNPPSLVNHALLSGGEDRTGGLAEIGVPFRVVHGTADPIFPYEHGVALARAAPGADLVTLDGGGHELHERDWDRIADAILSPAG